jgi:hypothetical protein
MQRNNVVKIGMVVLLLLLLVVAAVPAMAQGPDGEVGAQAIDADQLYWNPTYSHVADGDGTVSTKLNIAGAQWITGFTVVIVYDPQFLVPDHIRPGALLPGSRGEDYFWTVKQGVELTDPACSQFFEDSYNAFSVNVTYFDPALTVNGTGPILDIAWRSGPDANVGNDYVICVEPYEDFGYNPPFPDPDAPPIQGTFAVDNGGLLLPLNDSVFGFIGIVQGTFAHFRIMLEGGQPSWWVAFLQNLFPEEDYTEVLINGFLPCDGGLVQPVVPPSTPNFDPEGYCALDTDVLGPPPYDVKVKRFGYVSVEAEFGELPNTLSSSNGTSLILLAGDLNEDNKINLLDLHLMSSVLGAKSFGPSFTSGSQLVRAADYTGPLQDYEYGPRPDGTVNIIDMVLMAKNFGVNGPTDGTPPEPGTFPF